MKNNTTKRLDELEIGDEIINAFGDLEKVIYSDAKMNKIRNEYVLY